MLFFINLIFVNIVDNVIKVYIPAMQIKECIGDCIYSFILNNLYFYMFKKLREFIM